MIPDYKYLQIVAKSGRERPVLSWAHRTLIDSVPVYWTADGYRAHLSWRFPQEAGEHMPFAFSAEQWAGPAGIETSAIKVPNIAAMLSGGEPTTRVRFVHSHLVDLLKPFAKHRYLFMNLTVTAKEVTLASAQYTVRLSHHEIETLATDPFEIALSVSFLYDALQMEKAGTVVEMGFTTPEAIIRVGMWGKCAAVIMPGRKST